MPKKLYEKIEDDLIKFGKRVVNECEPLSLESYRNEPTLTHYNGWGKRIDEIKVHPSWMKLHDIVAEEGIISFGYSQKIRKEFGIYSRLYQLSKLYLFNPSSAFVSCPVSIYIHIKVR